ncbi:hypothetical protein FB565_007467 [Actinoplanes lutulentus]|uniref:hypothetical protein n=1 Tax=Actinoplanes lutulentus TaxID=1287878 RepID=UPI0011B9417F|nr:hypothetical protein [Actinoplanes lutulentus]MBB2947696.1 hypothetical protein [Actinoplanes lutulentus]
MGVVNLRLTKCRPADGWAIAGWPIVGWLIVGWRVAQVDLVELRGPFAANSTRSASHRAALFDLEELCGHVSVKVNRIDAKHAPAADLVRTRRHFRRLSHVVRAFVALRDGRSSCRHPSSPT